MQKKHFKLKLISSLILSCLALFGVVVVLPAVSPASGAQVADLLRSVLGPQPVADIESVSFQIKDAINQYISEHNGGKVQISIFQPTAFLPSVTARVLLPTGNAPVQGAQVVQAKPAINLPVIPDVVSAQPQIGWQAYGPTTNGVPVMAQALLSLDPQRPYAAIALVRIDLSRLQLHMMPGFMEPRMMPICYRRSPM